MREERGEKEREEIYREIERYNNNNNNNNNNTLLQTR